VRCITTLLRGLEIDHCETRAHWRRLRPEHSVAHILDRFAGRDVGRRPGDAPHQRGGEARHRRAGIAGRPVDQHFGDVAAVVTGDDAADRRQTLRHDKFSICMPSGRLIARPAWRNLRPIDGR